MARPTMEELIAGTGELASLPVTVVQLLEVLQDSAASADRVRSIVDRDPAMTANVLKLGNSAFYGARRTIGSVRDALVLLGNRTVATLAFATGMTPIMRRDLDGYGLDRDAFWRHCVVAAAVAARAAERRGRPEQRVQAFTAGLIHDVGMLVIDSHLVATDQSLPATDDEVDRARDERSILGHDHAEVGAALAGAWGFPAVLVEAVAGHHDPAVGPDGDLVIRAVAAGDLVAEAVQTSPGDPWQADTRAALAACGFTVEDFEDLQLDPAADLAETLGAAATPSGRPT